MEISKGRQQIPGSGRAIRVEHQGISVPRRYELNEFRSQSPLFIGECRGNGQSVNPTNRSSTGWKRWDCTHGNLVWGATTVSGSTVLCDLLQAVVDGF